MCYIELYQIVLCILFILALSRIVQFTPLYICVLEILNVLYVECFVRPIYILLQSFIETQV